MNRFIDFTLIFLNKSSSLEISVTLSIRITLILSNLPLPTFFCSSTSHFTHPSPMKVARASVPQSTLTLLMHLVMQGEQTLVLRLPQITAPLPVKQVMLELMLILVVSAESPLMMSNGI